MSFGVGLISTSIPVLDMSMFYFSAIASHFPLYFAGLERYDNLCDTIFDEELKISIEAVHLSDIRNSQEKLRYVRAQGESPDKYIVLDISTTEGLITVLDQVRRFC